MLESIAASSLAPSALITLLVILAALVVLALDLAATDLTMLGIVLILTLTGVLSPEETVRGFSNEALLAVAALFVVAEAVRKTSVLGYMHRLMTLRGSSISPAILRTMVPAASLSTILNNTPIVAILTPVVQERAREAGVSPSKLMIPLAYATSLGGLVTLIGTSTNLVVSGFLVREGHSPLSMFELAWVGVPVAVIGIAYFTVWGHRLLPERDAAGLPYRQELRSYHFELRVPPSSPLDGLSVEQAGLRALRGAFLAHIHRDGELVPFVSPQQVLRAGDVLTFVGNPDHLDGLLAGERLLRVVDPPVATEDHPLALFESVVSADSSLAGRSLSEVAFRDRFQAVVAGIQRRGERLTGPLGRIPIEPGDLLLVEGRPQYEALATASGDFYLVAPIDRRVVRPAAKAPVVLILLVLMVATIGTGILPVTTATFAIALLLIAVRAISAQDARRSVDLSVLITIASGFALAHAMEATGLARAVASLMLATVDSLGPLAALAAVYITTNILTEVLSNNAAAAIMFPLAAAVARTAGADVRAFAVAVAIAASAAFAFPIGYQTYLMVMGPGAYRFRDFVRAGLPLNLIVMAVALPIIAWRWM